MINQKEDKLLFSSRLAEKLTKNKKYYQSRLNLQPVLNVIGHKATFALFFLKQINSRS